MRPAPILVALSALVACTQPEAPHQQLQGSWRLEAAHRPLEPATLTLVEFGPTILGQATLVALDPVSPGVPSVSVTGIYSPPTASLDIRIDTTVIAHYTATLDRPGHMGGVIAFTDAAGGGTDTIAHIRP